MMKAKLLLASLSTVNNVSAREHMNNIRQFNVCTTENHLDDIEDEILLTDKDFTIELETAKSTEIELIEEKDAIISTIISEEITEC